MRVVRLAARVAEEDSRIWDRQHRCELIGQFHYNRMRTATEEMAIGEGFKLRIDSSNEFFIAVA